MDLHELGQIRWIDGSNSFFVVLLIKFKNKNKNETPFFFLELDFVLL